MKEVVELLQASSIQYLATVGRDHKTRCHPFMSYLERDGRLRFCTNSRKDVHKDMQANPGIKANVFDPGYARARLYDWMVSENNMEIKEGCAASPIIKGQYNRVDNPIFEVFYPDESHGVVTDFPGNPSYGFRCRSIWRTQTPVLRLFPGFTIKSCLYIRCPR